MVTSGDEESKRQRHETQDLYSRACEEGPGLCANLLTLASVLLIIVTFPLSLLFTVKVVQEYERAVIFRLGRLLSGGASGPGVFFVIPCMDIYVKIDMRTSTYEIPPQEILTKDSVTVFVNAIMYYKGILLGRESIAKEMQDLLHEATDPWGVTVERVEVKDVRVPEQLMRAMAAEAEAARNARAKVIAAEGEHKASRALRHAADVIADSPAALQLRYLQTLSSISSENNTTVIFPLPIDIMAAFVPQQAKLRLQDAAIESQNQQIETV